MRLALACPLLPTICTSISSLRSMSSPPTPLLKVLCIVYVSESRPAVIQQLLEHASSTGGARLVHSFSDVFYNRTSFYFAAAIQHSASSSSSGSSFLEGLLSFVSKSYAVVDRIDVANHPNIGIVDNVIFSPLGPEPDSSSSSSAEGAYAVICPLADALARGVADAHGVMAFRYGRGRQQRLLRDIRKSLGYFGTTTTTSGSSGSGSGYSSVMRMTAAQALEVVPDAVPDAESLSEAFERRGVVCVGASPYILNYNMRFPRIDAASASQRAAVYSITKAVREDNIEALTLRNECLEIACNLREGAGVAYLRSKVDQRISDVCSSAEWQGVGAVLEYEGYTTGPTEDELAARV